MEGGRPGGCKEDESRAPFLCSTGRAVLHPGSEAHAVSSHTKNAEPISPNPDSCVSASVAFTTSHLLKLISVDCARRRK